MAAGISAFRCRYDSDIEAFLHERAIPFEKAGKSKPYFIVNAEGGPLEIVAFFSLAINYIEISEKVSRSRRRKWFSLTSSGQVASSDRLGLLPDCRIRRVLLLVRACSRPMRN